ncbi:MAG: peptide chain release factor-like protein [Candidatus Omnitrophica bacterium]|nr:peptide chain release factor-like protein [Candidatus Omnitrophota bacterium]
MNKFGVSHHKGKELREQMARLGIREDALVESFIRSRGPGGQHVNKSSTAVYLKHAPSGVEVKSSSERSQALNRFMARKILVRKIELMVLGNALEEIQKMEKLRRQKRKRSKAAKEKMLAGKKMRARKKEFRRRVEMEY